MSIHNSYFSPTTWGKDERATKQPLNLNIISQQKLSKKIFACCSCTRTGSSFLRSPICVVGVYPHQTHDPCLLSVCAENSPTRCPRMPLMEKRFEAESSNISSNHFCTIKALRLGSASNVRLVRAEAVQLVRAVMQSTAMQGFAQSHS